MGVREIEAGHVTLVGKNVTPRTEIRLLKFLHLDPVPDPHMRDLSKIGLNRACFAVDDIEGVVRRVRQPASVPALESSTSILAGSPFCGDRAA